MAIASDTRRLKMELRCSFQSKQDRGEEYAMGSIPVEKDAFDPISLSYNNSVVINNRYCV